MKTIHGTIRRGGVALFTLVLVVAMSGVFTAGAFARPDKTPDRTLNDHPSGKDRTEEPGGSSTQGGSTSDPDGNSNGGADKPGGTGGFDADKDGNNGCGNDDDFEDDNNGNCGGRRLGVSGAQGSKGERDDREAAGRRSLGNARKNARGADQANVGGTTTVNGDEGGARVLGVSIERRQSQAVASLSGTAGSVAGTTATTAGDTAVLGTTAVRSNDSVAALAATGAPALALVMWGLVLIALGGTLLRTA